MLVRAASNDEPMRIQKINFQRIDNENKKSTYVR
jgi:hypothetical protein